MSHRLEKKVVDTKYHDYKEPKTSTRQSPKDRRPDQQAKPGGSVPEDAETTWNISRESESGRGSLGDEDTNVENVIKHENEERD